MTTFETSSLFIGALAVLCSFPIGFVAWVKLKGWQEGVSDRISGIENRLSKGDDSLKDGEWCLEEVRELKGKLFGADGSPTYLTRYECMMVNTNLKENFSLQVKNLKEAIDRRNSAYEETNKMILSALSEILKSTKSNNHNENFIS
jgi:hypothetical protein